MSKLTGSTRQELCEYLFDCRRSGMFGDGLEDEYIWDGVSIKGLNEMTDSELVDEAEQTCSDEDELIQKAQLELAVDSAIVDSHVCEWDEPLTTIRKFYGESMSDGVSELIDLGKIGEANAIINVLTGGNR